MSKKFNDIRGLWMMTIASFSLLLSSCGQSQTESVSEYTAVLNRLDKTLEEIRQLREEVAELRDEISKRPTAVAQGLAPTAAVSTLFLEENAPFVGAIDAKLAIVEFSDYQCPYCKRFHSDTFAQLKEKYLDTGKVKFIVRDFPLAFHQQAKSAAVAANCATEQGKYLEMREALFSNQASLGPEFYGQQADSLGLDKSSFVACLADSNSAASVNKDLQYGESVGVRGTPTFFIGRVEDGKLVDATRIVGAQRISAFDTVLANYQL